MLTLQDRPKHRNSNKYQEFIQKVIEFPVFSRIYSVTCLSDTAYRRRHAAKGDTMKITEQNFVRQMELGNEKALEYSMLHYGGLVKSVVSRYLGTLKQYEDECINDVFFAVWNHISSFCPEKNSFANWIAGVARIKALDCKRKYASRLLESSWEETERVMGFEPLEEAAQIQEEFSEETQQMLSCLKPCDRELFLRLYVEEQSFDEVSADSGMSKPVIYNRLSRAKKKIRQRYPR